MCEDIAQHPEPAHIRITKIPEKPTRTNYNIRPRENNAKNLVLCCERTERTPNLSAYDLVCRNNNHKMYGKFLVLRENNLSLYGSVCGNKNHKICGP